DVAAQTGSTGKIDVASIQVGQYDPKSGEPLEHGKWAYAIKPWEVPYRWYDDAIPEEFPESSFDARSGERTFVPQHNWSYLYETQDEWHAGSLAWTHTQRGNEPSYYAIYFDLLPKDAVPTSVPRAGFVGDGTERIEKKPPNTNGLLQNRLDVVDWNG